jgi:methylglutaconyl-CoA hydratase
VYQTIEVEHQAAIATVWLNRPEVHNAFNETVIEELDAALLALASNASVRVVVLAGRGRNFCAGADLRWMERAAGAAPEENLQDARRFAAMLRRLAVLGKPTIARVQGSALGGGMGLAAACDICVAALDASFAMTEVRLGLIPAVICPYVLRALGSRQCLRYMQTAERIGSERAQALGLVHEAVPAGELDACVQRLCAALCAGGPRSQAACKQLAADLDGGGLTDAVLERSAAAIARQRSSSEAREGLDAFFGKRPPAWAASGGTG